MKKLFLITVIVLSYFFNPKIYSLDQKEYKVLQGWEPFRKGIKILPYKADVIKGERRNNIFEDAIREDHSYKFPRVIANKNNEIQNSEWEKMNGLYGGSLRKFYKFDDKLFAVTDREVFTYENEVWKSLNFEDILCNIIHSMYRDSTGRVLVATDFGLYYSDNYGERWNKITVNWNDVIWDIYETRDGQILLSTTEGIYISRKEDYNFTLLTLKDVYVCTLTIDSAGNIWAGTNKGVLKSKYGDFKWQNMNLDETYYRKIICDSKNVIYTYSSYKVLKSTDSGNSWWSIEGSYYEDLTLDPKENLLITSAYQILIANSEGIQWVSKISDKFLLTTYYKDENEFLLGTLVAGALKYNLIDNKFIYFSEGLNVSTIDGLLMMANGELLASTVSDSLYVSKDNGLTWKTINHTGAGRMKSFKDGSVYITAVGGLMRSVDFGRNWEKLNLDVYPFFINAFDLSEDNKVICAGTSTGEVYVSYDAGEDFKLVRKSDYNFVDAIKIIDINTFLISCGQLYYTNDGGNSLRAVQDTLINEATNLIGDNLGYIYLSNFNGVFRSRDGIRWFQVSKTIKGRNFFTLDQFSNLYLRTLFGSVYYSGDQGKNWELAAGAIPNTIASSFAVTPDGYVFVGSQGKGLYRMKIDIKQNETSDLFFSNNYPNPFNASTRIEYVVTEDTFVKLEIYDLLGKKVETLLSEYKNKGKYDIIWRPVSCSSGIYLCKMQVSSKTQINKMVLIK